MAAYSPSSGLPSPREGHSAARDAALGPPDDCLAGLCLEVEAQAPRRADAHLPAPAVSGASGDVRPDEGEDVADRLELLHHLAWVGDAEKLVGPGRVVQPRDALRRRSELLAALAAGVK